MLEFFIKSDTGRSYINSFRNFTQKYLLIRRQFFLPFAFHEKWAQKSKGITKKC